MDWNYINTLLSVIHQAAAAGPKFTSIAAKAAEELNAYMEQPATDEPESEVELVSKDETLATERRV